MLDHWLNLCLEKTFFREYWGNKYNDIINIGVYLTSCILEWFGFTRYILITFHIEFKGKIMINRTELIELS